MNEINKQLSQMSAHDQKHYRFELSRLNETEVQQLEALLIRMVKAGAKKPFSWAWSEFREGIPQWGRFMIISSMYRSAHAVVHNVDAGSEFQSDTQQVYAEIVAALGEERIRQFLKAYGKGMLYSMLDLFDQGHPDYEHDDSWRLVEYDRETETTGKAISGLHEDFLEFEQEMEGL